MLHRFAQRDAHVFDGVVLVHVEIAACDQIEIERPVPRDLLEHVIEEADAGVMCDFPRPSRFSFSLMRFRS